MWEYTLVNLITDEIEIKYGYSNGNIHDNVFIRNKLNRSEWKILNFHYVD